LSRAEVTVVADLILKWDTFHEERQDEPGPGPGLTSTSPEIRSRRKVNPESLVGRGLRGVREET